ncbi:histidine phosphatase family protein [Rhodopirellula sp.]|jgi:broad specificity phosphatase PhoE|nr:histidine phosphatase family protein [Rhodopirellula sp.]MDA9777628.1 histidine phosphatase family protein [Rubripirellula sp.]
MISRSKQVGRVLLIRPGATEFDEQGRMKGSLDMPLSDKGRQQVDSLAEQLDQFELHTIYTAPCESALETAERLARDRSEVRIRVIDTLRNVDHGLWHGKLIAEVQRNLPRVYRQGQDSPADICPPGGESIRDARGRVLKAIKKILRKSGQDFIAIVIPEPLASVVHGLLNGEEVVDFWGAEMDSGRWELIESIAAV